MKRVVDLRKYEDVTKPQIVHLLNFTMSLDINHPNHMPVSRDLSATKRRMILEWLARPCFNSTHCLLNSSTTKPAINEDQTVIQPWSNRDDGHSCEGTGDFRQQPHDRDDYYAQTASFDPKFGVAQAQREANCFTDLKRSQCAVKDLRYCLQKALELEFYTIPLYLTALYSIKDGHNLKVYSLIRSVVMQEMLHMVQVANLLISIGGRPTIDSASAAPSYPTKGLPGGVLPNLVVSLQRASLAHIHKVFMAIEYPHEIFNMYDKVDIVHKQTIGQFYHNIGNCMMKHGDRIFYPNSTLFQIDWPYSNDYGRVYIVRNLATAVKAIDEIIEQGEGMQPGDPRSYRRDDLAHFFKFQEIVCGRELEFYDVSNYSFTGPPIPFNDRGVWPMRDNPGRKGLTPGTRTYNQAFIFHQTYRSLLRKLEQVFGGRPNGIEDAMAIMESLGLQAKILMAMPIGDLENRTCGPIFDYEWTD
jgi:rubrerythrin